jgi:histidyl-tRNA synthetase
VLGGGRYDGLMESLGGPPTPAVGWAAGIERLGMMLEKPATDTVEAVIIPVGDAAERHAGGVLAMLRRAGLEADMAFRGNMKRRMQKADTAGARYAVIIGDDELAAGQVILKALDSGEQAPLVEDLLPQTLADFLWDDMRRLSDEPVPTLSERMPRKAEGQAFWTLPDGRIVDPL